MVHRWGERRPFDPDEDHAMPEAIRVLPRDERGLPIPFAQLRVATAARTSAHSTRRWSLSASPTVLRDMWPWPLDYWIAFMGGPACERNRLFKDPAMYRSARATRPGSARS